MRSGRTFQNAGYIPAIWTLAGTAKLDSCDIEIDESMPAWLCAGVDYQDSVGRPREATWVVVRAETRNAAFERCFSEYGYSLVYAVERKPQLKEDPYSRGEEEDSNLEFWLLLKKITNLASNGASNKTIINEVNRYNPYNRSRSVEGRKRNGKEVPIYAENC